MVMDKTEIMDVASDGASRFLEALQTYRERLIQTLYNDLISGGAKSAKLFLSLSARPFRVRELGKVREFTGSVALGIRAIPEIGEPLDFGINIMWDQNSWFILTEVWIDSEKGQDLLKSFPEKRAVNLDECLGKIEEAVLDLSKCSYLIKRS